ncbi:MAG: hypothetical protein ACTJGR_10955 [Pauljensenia sp.]
MDVDVEGTALRGCRGQTSGERGGQGPSCTLEIKGATPMIDPGSAQMPVPRFSA